MNIEIGQYVTDGTKNLVVHDIKEHEGKKYIALYDEENEVLYFYELIRDNSGWKFEKVTNESLFKQLIILFSEIKEKIKEGKIDEIETAIKYIVEESENLLDES